VSGDWLAAVVMDGEQVALRVYRIPHPDGREARVETASPLVRWLMKNSACQGRRQIPCRRHSFSNLLKPEATPRTATS
jgi:hypothetical protein